MQNSGALTIKGGSTLSGNTGTRGGAIDNMGTATITMTTIYGNTAFDGGGILNQDATLSATDCTIADNQATSMQSAGGISNKAVNTTSIVRLLNCTIAGNGDTDPNDSAGQLYCDLAALDAIADIQLRNTIVAGDGTLPDGLVDEGGRITSMGHNLATDGSINLTGPGDLANTDPLARPAGQLRRTDADDGPAPRQSGPRRR